VFVVGVRRDANPAALADCVEVKPLVFADDAAIGGNDLAWRILDEVP
jgi:hypothetical protein